MRLYREVGGVELSMMEEQQIFICISDAFFNPRVYGCWLPLVTTSFFGRDQILHHLTGFFGFILICYVGSRT